MAHPLPINQATRQAVALEILELVNSTPECAGVRFAVSWELDQQLHVGTQCVRPVSWHNSIRSQNIPQSEYSGVNIR